MTEPVERPRQAVHLLRHVAVVAGTLTLAWGSLHALVDRTAVRERIRARAVQLLEARLPGAALGDDVRVDWLFRASVGPLTVPASAPGAPPVVGVGQITVRPAWWPLLSGRVEPASIRLLGVRLVPGPEGREALKLVERLGARQPSASVKAAAAAGAEPVVRLRGLTVALEHGGATYELGPFDADLERLREEAQERARGELRLPGGGRLTVDLRRTREPSAAAPPAAPPGEGQPEAGGARTAQPPLPGPRPSRPAAEPATGRAAPAGAALRPGAWSLTARLQVGAADLPAPLRRRSVTITAGTATLDVEADGNAEGVVASLRGSATGLTLAGAPLGAEPIGPLRLDGDGTAAFTRSDGRISLEQATLRLGGAVMVKLAGALSTRGDLPFEASVELEPVDYPALLAALPAALVPPAKAPHPSGAVGGSAALAGVLRGARPWTLQAGVDLAGLKETARRSPPSPLRLPFSAHLAATRDTPAADVLVGPENPSFVPIAELPEHVVRCVTTSEDAGFYGHQGFDFDELRNAAAAGAQAGKLLRGGSTITQQLAKNLFLSRDRSLARKAREALVTVALEGTVPKARLLEIYLNVIEWGPELHGIGRAARHYLDKDARALTPREACFLATLIPSPVRSHGALAGGVPVWRWSERIDDLLRKLHAVGLLDDDGLARELSAPLGLASWVPRQVVPPGADVPPAPLPADDADLEEAPPQAESAPSMVPAAPAAGEASARPGEGAPAVGPTTVGPAAEPQR